MPLTVGGRGRCAERLGIAFGEPSHSFPRPPSPQPPSARVLFLLIFEVDSVLRSDVLRKNVSYILKFLRKMGETEGINCVGTPERRTENVF